MINFHFSKFDIRVRRKSLNQSAILIGYSIRIQMYESNVEIPDIQSRISISRKTG